MSDLSKAEMAAKRMEYIKTQMSVLHPVMVKLEEETRKLTMSRMLGSRDSTAILSNMIKFARANKCLDIGVFTGYSSLAWALNIPEDGKVVACDVSTEWTDIGKPFWKEAGVEHKIDLRIAPASETLQSLIDDGESGTYDFMYIDADKTGYDTYYELGLKLVRKGGMIAIDNTFWGGQILDAENKSSGTEAIRQINAKVIKDSRVTAVQVNCGDGTTLCLIN